MHAGISPLGASSDIPESDALIEVAEARHPGRAMSKKHGTKALKVISHAVEAGGTV